MIISSEHINAAYNGLEKALANYREATLEEVRTKQVLERLRLQALADGKIEGRNAELREAAARQELPEEYKAYDNAAEWAAAARQELELARCEVSRVQALLRMAEMADQQLAAADYAEKVQGHMARGGGIK